MKKLPKILFSTFLLPCAMLSGYLYNDIDLLPYDPVSLFACEKQIDALFTKHSIKTVIELGSWAGASTRFFAYRVGEGGVVYAIDHWLGTLESRAEMKDPRLAYIYHQFLSNIYHIGLADRVIPVRMHSKEAHKAMPHISADLIFFDASRTANALYEEIMLWATHLNEGGVLCGTEWREKTVRAGVIKAAKELDLTPVFDRKGYFWILQEPSD